MAETHELRLKINAAAARSGAREFVGAINSIKTAIRQLDRDSNGVFTKLKKNLQEATKGGRVKLNIVDRTSLKNLESYTRLAGNAIKATGNSSRSVANLTQRMSALSVSYGTARGQADALTSSVARLNQQLARQATTAGSAASAAARIGTSGQATPRATGTTRAGADQAVADQERIQRAILQTANTVERLTTQLARVGGFQTISQLGREFRTFQREVSGGTMSAADFTRAQNQMRNAATQASTALTTLSAKSRDQVRAEREAAAASRERQRAMATAAREMRVAEETTARMINRLRAMGDVRGVEAVNTAMLRLRSSLAGGATSVAQVNTATSQYKNTLSSLRVGLLAAEGAAQGKARSAREVATRANEAAQATKRLERDMRSAAGAANAAQASFRNATGGLRGLENAFSGSFQAASLFRTALGSITLGTFTQSVFRAGDALQQFSITMEVASGSAEAAAQDLTYINDLSATLGTNLNASRDAFSKFAVASDIAGVSGEQSRRIFESVSTAMAVLGRGTEDQRLAFLALEQMMSKGVVSAEELRRQLGERLPGAVSMMAEALNVTVGELQDMLKAGAVLSTTALPKFADVLERRFGSQLERTFNRAGSNLGRLQNEFIIFLETIASSGFLDELSVQFRDLTSLMRSSEVRDAAAAIGEGLANAASIAGDALQFLARNMQEVGQVVVAVIGGIIVAQFARMGQAALLGGQQVIIAANAFRALKAEAAQSAAAVTAAGSAAGSAAAQHQRLAAAAGQSAAVGGRLGAAFGTFGRVLGVLGGPVGIAISALTLVPMFLSDIGDQAEGTSREYDEAMRRMGVATSFFIDRAREAATLNPFEQFNLNLPVLQEAGRAIAEFRTSGTLDSSLSNSMNELIALAPSASTEIQTLFEQIQKLRETPDISQNINQIEDIERRMVSLIGTTSGIDGAFDGFRSLEEVLLSGRRAIELYSALMDENREIVGENADDALRLANAMAELDQAFVTVGDDLTQQLADLGVQLASQGANTAQLSMELEELAYTFDGTEASMTKTRESLESLRAGFAATAADTSLPQWQRESAQRFVEQADAALETVDALVDLQAQTAATAAEQAALTVEVQGSSNAMSGAISMAFNYAEALRSIGDARREVGSLGAAANERREGMLNVAELRASGDERGATILQDRLFGDTARVVADMREELEKATAARDDLVASFERGDRGTDQQLALAAASAEVLEIERRINAEYEAGAASAARLFDLRQQARGGSGSAGGGAAELTALQEMLKAGSEHVKSLDAQNHAHTLLASGMTQSADAANILGEAFANGVNLTDQQTQSFIAQIEAAERLNKALAELANDPVNAWMDSVPSWREAGQQIETEVFESLGNQISQFIQTGKFSFEELGSSILATAADLISDMAVQELVSFMGGNVSGQGQGGFGLGTMLSEAFGNSSVGQVEGDPLAAGYDGMAAGQNIMNAMTQGGTQAAQLIQQAMVTAAANVQSGIVTGGTVVGTQLNTQVTSAGTTAGGTMQAGIQSGGSVAATQIGAAVQAGAVTGSPILAMGVEQGSQQGGGFFQNLFSGMFGGGGGGGGGIGGMIASFIPALFGSGGGVTSGSGPAIPQVMAPAGMFKNAPQFAMGTPNISGGVPAILHDNEAVVPLTGGRKIPIEGDVGGGGQTNINNNFYITTPDADSFRKSQGQIAAEAAMTGQRAMRRLG